MKRKGKATMKRKKPNALNAQVEEIKKFLKKHQGTIQLRQAIRLYC